MHLRQLPVDYLKIDRTFIAGMLTEPEDATIVATTVRLAQALGVETMAEGVESEDQLMQLRMLGCDYGQRFYWARPMAPGDLERWWAG